MRAIIEIEKGSKIKSELHEGGDEDKALHKECPYYYGYIKNTEAEDGDPADAIIISEKKYKKGQEVDIPLKDVIKMTDNGKKDDKFVLAETEYNDEVRKEIKNYIREYKKSQGDDITIHRDRPNPFIEIRKVI